MRPALAVLLALVFAALFVVALLVSRVVNTAGDPSEISGVIEDADLYDFVYDRVLDAALMDLVSKGITVQSTGDEPHTLEFEDPAQAHAAIKSLIETILPREYVRQKIEETLNGVIPYASGRQDGFQVDLETSDRIDAVPEAVRKASERIGLGELVVSGLMVPMVRDLSQQITDEALGIGFTPDEAEDAARRIFPPQWIESQVFSFVDQAAPYFSGTGDDLNIVITFKDRVPVAGQVLKEKLNDEDTLVKLVFEQIVGPLVGQIVGDSTVLAFGIVITDQDIREAVEIVAPPDWVRAQGDGIIDSVVAWLVGATENIEYTLLLADRKADAAVQLEALAMRKLDEQIAATPVCQNPAQAAAAVNDVLAAQFPSCLPQNASEVLDVMQPLIGNEIDRFVSNSIPDQITYSDADLRAQLGADSLGTLDSLRDRVVNGFTFTDEDLLNRLGNSEDPGAAENFQETLDIIRAGIVFDETDITGRMDVAQLDQFNEARNWINLGWTFRWVIFLPAVLLLLAVAFVGGRGWPGRVKWAGAPVAIVAIIFFGAIQVGWASTASFRDIAMPADSLDAETRADFPAIAALADSGEFQGMVERVGSSWISGLAMSAVPWAVGGLVLFGLGFLYPKYQHHLPAMLGGSGGPPDGGRVVIPRGVTGQAPGEIGYEEDHLDTDGSPLETPERGDPGQSVKGDSADETGKGSRPGEAA